MKNRRLATEVAALPAAAGAIGLRRLWFWPRQTAPQVLAGAKCRRRPMAPAAAGKAATSVARLLPQVLVLVVFLTLLCTAPARAQLATSFYTITGIETRRLPNAVQIVIRTDGTVIFGGDFSEWIDFSNDDSEPKPLTQLRLRLVRARARIPAFNTIGAYPIDSAQVTLGRTTLEAPYFTSGEGYGQPEPRVDISLRFFKPVKIYRFGEVRLGDSFDPLDVEVRLGDDRRSIVVTVISDRVDDSGAERMRRIKPEEQRSQLALGKRRNGDVSVSALHVPLPDLLSQLARASGEPIVGQPSLDAERVTLRLDAPLQVQLQTLARGLGLVVSRRGAALGGGWEVGRDESLETRRLPLQNLSPERARLLLPDWLLPHLRADVENNALIASASPTVLDKIARDLQVLDRRRFIVRVQAEVYEVSRREADVLAYSLAFGQSGLAPAQGAPNPNYIPPAFTLESGGVGVFRLDNGGAAGLSSWRVRLEALRTSGRVRLRARPFISVLSGESGTLFLGQSRFIPVLRSTGGGQDVQALNVPVGYSLTARPRVLGGSSRPGEPPQINLFVNPRASTVDEIEAGSGLPTIGIREASTSMRLRSGDALIVAGLDSDIQSRTRNRRLPARRDNSEQISLLVIVTASVI